jgi:hypothetical protein
VAAFYNLRLLTGLDRAEVSFEHSEGKARTSGTPPR